MGQLCANVRYNSGTKAIVLLLLVRNGHTGKLDLYNTPICQVATNIEVIQGVLALTEGLGMRLREYILLIGTRPT